ncbi:MULTISPECIES: helix-turn-helix transcriptional regulator [Paenarthrobacter]|uniref:helix-turn-helix transcriptional regulator n=1 Tax=Paenarthrobacter TaxID=1742992 RepID=UPI0021C5C0B7|nr:helix-turn-helix domain-containing protein [Paenarthrobacter sp. JL.01a]UXM93304.1 helix-turn-helix domain-containing protein [Paenarthrobacter sp. JL.01a]
MDIEPQRHLTPQELADRLSVPLSSVYGWRARHTGPLGMRVGKHVRYRIEDVLAWEAQLVERAVA